MKNLKKTLLGFLVLTLVFGIMVIGCDNGFNPDNSIPDTSIPDTTTPDTIIPEVSFPDDDIPDINVGEGYNPIVKYFAIPNNNFINDIGIKYSFTYDNYDFFYIYLGELQNIPIYSHAARYYDGFSDWTYTISKENITENNVREAISGTKQNIIGVIDSHTISKTTGGRTSFEINGSFGIKDVFSIGAKVAGETNWSNLISNTSTNSVQRSTSLTDTIEHATSFTWITMEEDQFRFSSINKAGYYRYSLFSASDVYLYVIRDTITNEIFYEFKEHVIPDGAYYWRMDYSNTPSFRKSDATNFEFDASLLNELSKPEFKPKLDFSSENLAGLLELTGIPQEGQTLTANIILINSGGPFNYQWMRNGTTPIGSNSDTYTVQSDDVGSTITVVVTCAEYPGSVTSNATSTIFLLPPITYTLTVNQNTTTGGSTNISTLSGIGTGTPVNIIATANNNYRFKYWDVLSGFAFFDDIEKENTNVTLSSNATIIAIFEHKIVVGPVYFDASKAHTYTIDRAGTVEIYALGAGGGGQGGHYRYDYRGTGGAGGGGAAVYMKFDVIEFTSFTINVGKGGSGGRGYDTHNAWRSGYKGSDGGSTVVGWNGGDITVDGGKGGGEGRADTVGTDTTGRTLTGGSGGKINVSIKPLIVTSNNWIVAVGSKGDDGIQQNAISSQGGSAGSINIGSLGSFGGGNGGYNHSFIGKVDGTAAPNFSRTIPDRGCGGAGGYSANSTSAPSLNLGQSGRDGLVVIIFTYWE